MSKLLIPPSDTGLTDVSDANSDNNDVPNEYQQPSETFVEQSIEAVMIQTEKNLHILTCLDMNTFDKLVKELELSLLKQLKHSIRQLKNDSLQLVEKPPNIIVTNTEIAIDNNVDVDLQHDTKDKKEDNKTQFGTYLSSHNNNNHMLLNVAVSDTASVATERTNATHGSIGSIATDLTGVSSIGAPIEMDDALVVMMGIGKYDGLPDLAGIPKDYDNVIDTFVKHWKYKIFFMLNDNSYIYTNNSDDINTNYKLTWNGDDIDDFLENSRKCIVKNKHNGLIFVLSSHGDSGKVFYDSDCEQYDLDALFGMYSPSASGLLSTYKETERESNHLLTIPKLFFLDMCRGNGLAQVTNTNIAKDKMKQNTISLHENKKMEKIEIAATKKTTAVDQEKHKEKKEEDESFCVKGISKEDAHILVAQMANFSKVYANTDGFAVGDGSKGGGIFLRTVCKVFKDTKFVSRHKWADLILKIRERTKREATQMNNLFNFTQLVENEGTLEREVIFGSKHAKNIATHLSLKHSHLQTLDELSNMDKFGDINDINIGMDSGGDDGDQLVKKLSVTNLSQTNTIAVLVESEQNRENRKELFRSLENITNDEDMDDDGKYNEFKEHGFVIIDTNYGTHEFSKVWDEYYVTIFDLSNYNDSDSIANHIHSPSYSISHSFSASTNSNHNHNHKHSLICDRRVCFNDRLYVVNDQLYDINDNEILSQLKCNAVSNESHQLTPITNMNRVFAGDDSESKLAESVSPAKVKVKVKGKAKAKATLKCRFCLCGIGNGDLKCAECKRVICKNCCHSLVCNKIPKNMKQSQFVQLRIVNTSKWYNIAVLVNVYDKYNKQRSDIIAQETEYQHWEDEDKFSEHGFTVIDAEGADYVFNCIWGSACITLIKLGNGMNEPNRLIHNKLLYFDDSLQLYYINDELRTMHSTLPRCKQVVNQEHGLFAIMLNEDVINDIGQVKCALCSSKVEIYNYIYYCHDCGHSFCRQCCNAIRSHTAAMNITKQEIRIFNTSKSRKIGILLTAEQIEMVDLQRFIMDESEFMDKGFTVIYPKEFEIIHTVWDRYYVTSFELGLIPEIICINEMFASHNLCFGNGSLYPLLKSVQGMKCNLGENESHDLHRILVNEENINLYVNLDKCILCSSTIETPTDVENGDGDNINTKYNYNYYCKKCEHSICQNCCNAIVLDRTPMRLERQTVMQITKAYQNTKSSILMSCQMVQYQDQQWQHQLRIEIGNDSNKISRSHLIEESDNFTKEISLQIPLDIDNLEKEFKESQINCRIEITSIDDINNITIFNQVQNIPVWISDPYICTFTTLNGKGRFGPTNMDEYKNQCHFNDTTLEMANSNQSKHQLSQTNNSSHEKKNTFTFGRFSIQKHKATHSKHKINYKTTSSKALLKDENDIDIKNTSHNKSQSQSQLQNDHDLGSNDKTTGMQLWTVPKTGCYRVCCYGAKGGDSMCNSDSLNRQLFGGKGAKVGAVLKLYENDIVKIACGQQGQASHDGGGGGGGGTFFVLHKISNNNPNYKEKAKNKNKDKDTPKEKDKDKESQKEKEDRNKTVNIPLIIAAGGHGANDAENIAYTDGIDGLCDLSENRNDYGGYETNGSAARGGSFKNDFNIFQSYIRDDVDYNKCNSLSFLDGAIGGQAMDKNCGDGGFGCGGAGDREGGAGGGYIGGIVPPQSFHWGLEFTTTDTLQEKCKYGALSYVSDVNSVKDTNGGSGADMMVTGCNNGDGKIQVTFLGQNNN